MTPKRFRLFYSNKIRCVSYCVVNPTYMSKLQTGMVNRQGTEVEGMGWVGVICIVMGWGDRLESGEGLLGDDGFVLGECYLCEDPGLEVRLAAQSNFPN